MEILLEKKKEQVKWVGNIFLGRVWKKKEGRNNARNIRNG